MGRYINSGSGSGVGGSSATPAITTTVTTGEAVTQGQIAVLGADSLAYMGADPSVMLNAVRPVSAPSPITNTFLSSVPIIPDGAPVVNASNASANLTGQSTFAGAVLSNGNYVVAWQLGTGNFTPQFAIFNSLGVQQGATVSVDNVAAIDATGFVVSLCALTGGGFALAFFRNVAPWFQYAVYDNTGAVVKALTTVNAATTAAGGYVSAVALSNGGFALAYYASTAGYKFVIYNSAGTIVANHTTIDAAASGYVTAASFTAAQGGGFVVAYSTVAAGTKVVKYTNAGAVAVAAQATGGGNSGYSNVCVLAGGGYATVTINGSFKVAVFNAAGAQQGATLSIGTAMTATWPMIAALSSGDVAVASTGTTGNTVLAYVSGTTGTLLKSVLYSVLSLAVGSSAVLSMLPIKQGGVSIMANIGGTGVSAVFDANASLVNPVGAIPAAHGGCGSSPPVLFALPTAVNPNANLAVFGGAQQSGGALAIGLLNMFVQKLVPIGVFSASAAQGASVPVQYTGNATLATAFAQPYNVDTQSQSPPGQRMNVLGNSIVMSGIQASSRVRRYIN
ncbi:MAG: hypothetical protein PHQ05_04960 [Sterolibacterium sp.]|nr:hypothetical protein [Sterolibacterium sp.]